MDVLQTFLKGEPLPLPPPQSKLLTSSQTTTLNLNLTTREGRVLSLMEELAKSLEISAQEVAALKTLLNAGPAEMLFAAPMNGENPALAESMRSALYMLLRRAGVLVFDGLDSPGSLYEALLMRASGKVSSSDTSLAALLEKFLSGAKGGLRGELVTSQNLLDALDAFAAKLDLQGAGKLLFNGSEPDAAQSLSQLKKLISAVIENKDQVSLPQERELLRLAARLQGSLESSAADREWVSQARAELAQNVIIPFLASAAEALKDDYGAARTTVLSRRFALSAQLLYSVLRELELSFTVQNGSAWATGKTVADEAAAREIHAPKRNRDDEIKGVLARLFGAGRTAESADAKTILQEKIDLNAVSAMLSNVEQMLQGQELLQQLNTLMDHSAEPYFMIFPALISGFLSRIELTQERSSIDDKAKRAKRKQNEPERVDFSMTLPNLGYVAAHLTFRKKELFLRLECENKNVSQFLRRRSGLLERAFSTRGYQRINIRTVTVKEGRKHRPGWVKDLVVRDGVVA